MAIVYHLLSFIMAARSPRKKTKQNFYSLYDQQTTVEEQSRIVQLEEELRLRRMEIADLQAKVRGMDGTSSNGEVAPNLQEASHRETGEEALTSCRQEVDSLRASLDRKNQEISDLKQKVQQDTKENMEMMDTWKVKNNTHSLRLQLLTEFN